LRRRWSVVSHSPWGVALNSFSRHLLRTDKPKITFVLQRESWSHQTMKSGGWTRVAVASRSWGLFVFPHTDTGPFANLPREERSLRQNFLWSGFSQRELNPRQQHRTQFKTPSSSMNLRIQFRFSRVALMKLRSELRVQRGPASKYQALSACGSHVRFRAKSGWGDDANALMARTGRRRMRGSSFFWRLLIIHRNSSSPCL
jgi:hypothetical protein